MNFEINNSEVSILIVDDNQTNLQLLNKILIKNTFRVIASLSAKKALEILTKVKVDLILLDVMMPEMDGLTFAKILSSDENLKDIPIIFLTAKSNPEDIVEGFNSGGLDYLVKPSNPTEILIRVENQLRLKYSKDLIIEQNRKLEELVQEKNDLLAIAAHDLKNPLSSIFSLADLLRTSSSKLQFSEQEKIFEMIFNTSKKMYNIISDILDNDALEESKEKVKFETFDLIELINNSISSFSLDLEYKKIIIDKVHKKSYLKICSDKVKINSIFDNLLSNSIKFSPFQKKIFVETGEVYINNVKNFYFEIMDQGPGFSENDKLKAFKKFSRLSAKPTNNESSTGLGLSIIKNLVHLLNGKIELYSEQNKGARFVITIPNCENEEKL